MLVRIGNSRMLRYAGLFTWAAVGLWLIIFLIDPQSLPLDELDGAWVLLILRWLVVYLLFGGVYWWITRSLGDRKPGIWDHLGLLLLTCCAIGVSYLSGTALGSILLMVVAGLTMLVDSSAGEPGRKRPRTTACSPGGTLASNRKL